MTTLEILRAARRLIEKPEDWIQGRYRGHQRRFCAVGAIEDVNEGWSRLIVAANALAAVFAAGAKSVIDLSDTHTHTEVLALSDTAIAWLEKEEVNGD